jgi:glycosyltransferase involved in cell wall biosynthesis
MGGSSQLIVDLIEHLGDRYDQKVIARDLPVTPAYTNLEVFHYPQMTEEIAEACMKRFQPDLLHIHFLGHHGNPYSVTDWHWYDALFRGVGDSRPIVENLNIPVDPYVSPAVSKYVYVSDYVRANFGPSGRDGVTIYPGSDLAHFSRRTSSVPGPDPDVFGMACRLEGDKLNERSIEPLIKVVASRPSTTAVVVGDGNLLPGYREQVDSAGVADSFEFTGYVSYQALPAHIGRMSVFLTPVHRESFGQMSVFAMGLELPVAGYDTGALAEVHGSRDLLVSFDDSDALCQLIIELLDDPDRCRTIGRKNRDRAMAQFSVERMVEAYDGVYREVLA